MGREIKVQDFEIEHIRKLHEERRIMMLKEQDAYTRGNMGIQCFLNNKGVTDDGGQPLVVDGRIGNYPQSKSAQAIYKYQDSIGMTPDGEWGDRTVNSMPPEDRALYDKCQKNPRYKVQPKI